MNHPVYNTASPVGMDKAVNERLGDIPSEGMNQDRLLSELGEQLIKLDQKLNPIVKALPRPVGNGSQVDPPLPTLSPVASQLRNNNQKIEAAISTVRRFIETIEV